MGNDLGSLLRPEVVYHFLMSRCRYATRPTMGKLRVGAKRPVPAAQRAPRLLL